MRAPCGLKRVQILGRWLAVWLALPGLVATARPVSAQVERTEAVGGNWSASIGATAWLSYGETSWEHESPAPPLLLGSQLRWRDIEGPVYSLEGDFVWRRLVLTAAGGWGSVESGNLIDDDFVRNTGSLLSSTRSTVDDGSIYYANINFGWRAVEWRDSKQRKGFLDLLAGYRWWHERYEAFGILTLAASASFPASNQPSSVKVITHEWTWQSVRVGGRAYFPFPRGVGVRGAAFFFPRSSLEVEDTHHLRTDLRQDPSIVTKGTGGFGYQVEGALTYTFWRGLGAEAGYRHWQVALSDGDVQFRNVTGSGPKLPLREASSERSGFFAGLYYRF